MTAEQQEKRERFIKEQVPRIVRELDVDLAAEYESDHVETPSPDQLDTIS